MNRILIVEDEERIASFMEKGLRKNGFATEIAKDGDEALAKVKASQFDLLLLDLGLPVKDGWSVLHELKNQKNQIPVIIITASEDIKTQNSGFDYITKPFKFKILLFKIQAYLN